MHYQDDRVKYVELNDIVLVSSTNIVKILVICLHYTMHLAISCHEYPQFGCTYECSLCPRVKCFSSAKPPTFITFMDVTNPLMMNLLQILQTELIFMHNFVMCQL